MYLDVWDVFCQLTAPVGADELVPEEGKDEVYDNIMQEIKELEDELNAELKAIRKQTGYALIPYSLRSTFMALVPSLG